MKFSVPIILPKNKNVILRDQGKGSWSDNFLSYFKIPDYKFYCFK